MYNTTYGNLKQKGSQFKHNKITNKPFHERV